MSYPPIVTADTSGVMQQQPPPQQQPPQQQQQQQQQILPHPQHPTQSCEAAPTEESFVPSLATVYEHLVKLTPPGKGQITRFHAIKPPDISIKDYLERIKRYFGCSNECFVLSLVYIDRIVKIHEDFSVSILNVHRLLITSVMLAAKFFDDVYYSNQFYGRVGGVRTREINILEAHFLSLLDFHLFVSPQEYDQYRQNVLNAVLHPQPVQRPVKNSLPPTPKVGTPKIRESTVGSGCTPSAALAANATSVREVDHQQQQQQQVRSFASPTHQAPRSFGTSSSNSTSTPHGAIVPPVGHKPPDAAAVSAQSVGDASNNMTARTASNNWQSTSAASENNITAVLLSSNKSATNGTGLSMANHSAHPLGQGAPLSTSSNSLVGGANRQQQNLAGSGCTMVVSDFLTGTNASVASGNGGDSSVASDLHHSHAHSATAMQSDPSDRQLVVLDPPSVGHTTNAATSSVAHHRRDQLVAVSL